MCIRDSGFRCPKGLLFLGSDLQEDQSADDKYDQPNRKNGFQFHYSVSSFLRFLNPTTPSVAAPAAETPSRTSPVSYTHLDVYKRQVKAALESQQNNREKYRFNRDKQRGNTLCFSLFL